MIFLLHCTSSYPAAYEEVNLNVLKTYQSAFGLPVGYSDHTIGYEVASAAVAMGACIIEKHFTLSRDLEGCDQRASAEPFELERYVQALRNVYQAMGDGNKRATRTEIENMKAMRRFIVAGRDIKKGSIIQDEDLLFQKVTHGLQPRYAELIIGRRAATNIYLGQRITLGMVNFGDLNV
jgi:N,N'-diacetyllegionaminate synthase